jgi:CBS domain-containing protein/ribosome-associated translation inhibitor RaiA
MMQELSAADFVSTDFVRASSSDFASSLVGKMLKAGKTNAVVFDDSGNYLGLVSKLSLIKRHADLSKIKLSTIVETKPRLLADDAMQRVIEQLYSSDSKILPVFKGPLLVGVADAALVVSKLKDDPALRNLSAREIGSMQPVVLPDSASIGKALSIMQEKHITKIPLVDRKGLFSGIVCFSDLMSVLLRPINPDKGTKGTSSSGGTTSHESETELSSGFSSSISSEATSDAASVSPSDPLHKILDTMSSRNVSNIVIIEDKKPVGIVTVRDLLEVFLRVSERKERRVQFAGLPEIDEIDRQHLDNSVASSFDKIAKIFPGINYLAIHFKQHRKAGLRVQHTVNCRLSVPGGLVVSSATDWSLLNAAQDALRTLEREVIGKKRR